MQNCDNVMYLYNDYINEIVVSDSFEKKHQISGSLYEKFIKTCHTGIYDKLLFLKNRELAFEKGTVYLSDGKTILFRFSAEQTDVVNQTQFWVQIDSEFHAINVCTTFLPKRGFGYQNIEEDYFKEKPGLELALAIKLTFMFCEIQRTALSKKQVIDKIRHSQIQNQKSNNVLSHKNQIRLNSKFIYRYELPEEKRREFIRHCEAWAVRGHYRNYKSGKTVFIQPYVKGKGKLNNKIYVEGGDGYDAESRCRNDRPGRSLCENVV